MEKLVSYIQSFSDFLPLEWFVFLGGIVEEVIAPIPSPVIMTFAGSTLSGSEVSILLILFIGMLGGIGKTIGSLVLYYIGYYFEEFFINKCGKYFGLTPKIYDKYASKVQSLSYGVFWIALLRAAPFIPSAPFSGLFGILKYDVKKFLLGTLIGNIFRDSFYVYLGYLSFRNLDLILHKLSFFDSILTILIIVSILYGILRLRRKFSLEHK